MGTGTHPVFIRLDVKPVPEPLTRAARTKNSASAVPLMIWTFSILSVFFVSYSHTFGPWAGSRWILLLVGCNSQRDFTASPAVQ